MPNRSRIQRVIKKRDKLRSNWCRRCRFRAPSGRCLDTTIRNGRCGDWVYYLLPGNKQCRRRWVRPKDPRTPAQRQNRARLAAASRNYSAVLSHQEQGAFIAAGARTQSRPRLGQSGPLTGQQYAVHNEYATSATGKVKSTKNPAKVQQPQKVTQSTWGTRRGIAVQPPGEQGRRLAGRSESTRRQLVRKHRNHRSLRDSRGRATIGVSCWHCGGPVRASALPERFSEAVGVGQVRRAGRSA